MAGDVVDASAGGAHSLAVLATGAVFGFGLASFGRTGVDVGWPRRANVWRPEAVALAARVVRVAAGGEHSLALDDGGGVWSWGRGGLHGRATARDAFSPAPVPLPPAVAIAAHAAHALAATAPGDDDGRCTVYAWGRGDHGRLGVADEFGNCDIRDRATPTVVTLPSEADRRRHARAPYY